MGIIDKEAYRTVEQTSEVLTTVLLLVSKYRLYLQEGNRAK